MKLAESDNSETFSSELWKIYQLWGCLINQKAILYYNRDVTKKKTWLHKDYAHIAHNTCSSSALKTKQIHYWLNKPVDIQYLRRGLNFIKFPTEHNPGYCVKNTASCMW